MGDKNARIDSKPSLVFVVLFIGAVVVVAGRMGGPELECLVVVELVVGVVVGVLVDVVVCVVVGVGVGVLLRGI